jgi:predicted transcriptional regulator
MPPLGPLEKRVLETLWLRSEPLCVRDLQPAFSKIAYTTLMTTLDRLYRKGLLERNKRGRAFFYHPKITRSQLESAAAAEALHKAFAGGGHSWRVFLASLVDAVADRDHRLLEELDRLVRARLAEQ